MRKGISARIPVIYSDSYYVEIGDHVFPTSKYRLIKKRLDNDLTLKDHVECVVPQRAKDEEILLVHTKEYFDKLKNCALSNEEVFKMELPLSKQIVESSLICCGGTILTAREALTRRAAIHIGGGFHHAFPDHGEGFCALNDIAVSINVLRDEGLIKKALIIDCDLHQGNGTAYIFRDNRDVFTFSIHQENNYPFLKPPGDLDIGLRDYTGDSEYLKHLKDNVPAIINMFRPELILYVAGADPYKDDQLGKLMLTKAGLRERDNFIAMQAFNYSVPLAIVLAGGYSKNREDTVDIHYATIEECIKVFTS